MSDCFNNIIGLIKQPGTCFEDDFNASATESNSGLFVIGSIPEAPSIQAIAANKESGILLQDILNDAREQGIADFKRELYRELGTRYAVRQQPYDGVVGQQTGNGFINLTYPLQGLALEMQRTRGAVVEVTGIQPQFNYDGVLEVRIYKAVTNGTGYQIIGQVATLNLTTAITSPEIQKPVNKLLLEATDDTGKQLTYLFMYAPEPGSQARNNSTSCGCGNKEAIMHQFLRPYGVSGTGVGAINLSNRTNSLNGLLLTVSAQCGTGDFICHNYHQNEFIRESVNWAILYRSVSNAISGILNSQFINRYSLANREQMAFNVNVLGGKFRKSVAWLSEHMDLSSNDCFICQPGGKGGIFDYQIDGILL